MSKPLQKDDIVVCQSRAPKALLTVGKEYRVLRIWGEGGEYPTVENDDGRPTQYHHRWFDRRASA